MIDKKLVLSLMWLSFPLVQFSLYPGACDKDCRQTRSLPWLGIVPIQASVALERNLFNTAVVMDHSLPWLRERERKRERERERGRERGREGEREEAAS